MSEKISNLEKVLVFMQSIEDSRTHSDQDDNRLIVDIGFKKFIEKDKYFSDVEAWFLPLLKKCREKISDMYHSSGDLFEDLFIFYSQSNKNFNLFVKNVLPINPQEYKTWKAKNPNSEDENDNMERFRFIKYFMSLGNTVSIILYNFDNKLKKEFAIRSKNHKFSCASGTFTDDTDVDLKHQKKIHEDFNKELEQDNITNSKTKLERKVADLSRKDSFDDTVVDVHHQRKIHDDFLKNISEKVTEAVQKAKDLEEVEQLYLMYTTTRGCDLINAFLRGDLSLAKSKEENQKQKASWGTNLTIDLATFIEILEKALKLKKNLMSSQIKDEMVVYRGVSFNKLLDSIKSNTDSVKTCIEEMSNKNSSTNNKTFASSKIIYQSKDITSTSTSSAIARGHATRTQKPNKDNDILPIVMEITLKKGTAFGKNFKNTTFGSDDYNKELVLAPNQKIEISEIQKAKGGYITLKCSTIQCNANFN